MSILRIFKKETHTDPAMLQKQADAATAIHSITVPKYRVKGNFVEYIVECSRVSTTWQVYRRYQQFKALDQQLKALCPMGTPHHCEFGVIPVLSGSHWTEVTNQSPELVERRRRYLEIYLQQLLVPKNLFYAAKTPLYHFLHDGEVPILHKSRSNRPLPGFGIPYVFTTPNTDEQKMLKDLKNEPESDDDANPKQVVGVQHSQREQATAIGGGVPNYSKNSAERPKNAIKHVDPVTSAVAPQDAMSELCTACGYEAIIDYDISEWTAEGRCPNCKEHVTFKLKTAAEKEGEKEAKTDPSSAKSEETKTDPSTAEKVEAKGVDNSMKKEEHEEATTEEAPETKAGPLQDGMEVADRGESKPAEESTEQHKAGSAEEPKLLDEPVVSASGRVTRSSTDVPLDDVSEPEEELVDEDDRLAQMICCAACNRLFDLQNLARRCKMCNIRFCRTCTKKVALRNIATSPSASTIVRAETNKSGDAPLSRVCERCLENLTRREPLTAESHSEGSPTGANAAPASSTPQPKPRPTVPQRSGERKDMALSDFQLITTLGRGTFGKVIKVRHIPTDEIFAMKILNKSVVHKRRVIDNIKEEKNVMKYLAPHPFICTCHYTFQTDYHLFFVLDYLPGGELYAHMYPNKNLSESDSRLYIAQVILGVEHIHKHDIAHRDLKPENIVLDRDGFLRITDFGLARMHFSRVRRRSFVGSAEYLAPETIQGDIQTKAIDWWSVGVMLYEMLCGAAPFHAATNNAVYQAVLNKKLDFASHPGCFSPAAMNLISKLLEKDVRARLTDPEKIKAHPFFNGIDWDALYQGKITPPFVPNLDDNDTKYFNRDFTSEWATIQKPQGVGRQTIDMLNRRFSNFRAVPENRKGATGKDELPNPSPSMPHLINPDVFVGIWRLVKVEMVTTDGKTCYPWGSEVAGLLTYTANGLYAIQLCPLKRSQFRNVSIDKITREELSDAYLSYVAAFGTYELPPGKNYIVHTVTVGLYPNAANTREKRFFEVVNDNRMSFMTAPLTVEEGVVARTVVTWEKVSGMGPI